MKRQLIVCVLLVGFSSLASRLCAQDTPAAVAERQEWEERFKRTSADIEDLKSTIHSYQLRLNEQREELRRLNEELARAGSNKDVVTREDLKHLADKIREVDEKRIADYEKIRAEFDRLGKVLSAPPKGNSAPSSQTRPPVEPKGASEKGFEYIIRQNDNPRVIAQALGKQGVKVSQQQIIDSNPAIKDWTKLRIGQKIFIPGQP